MRAMAGRPMPSPDIRATCAQLLDVAQRVAARAALGAGGHDEAEAVVLPERLRMHARQLGGDGDREDRGVLVDLAVLSHVAHLRVVAIR